MQPEAPLNCQICPRLAHFREENKRQYPDWFNGPAPSFGPKNAELLIIGLAPGLRGANRTGRPFTGDDSGDLLFATLKKFGFAKGENLGRSDDNFTLVRTMITNAVRCLPPENKPSSAEINACRPFLDSRIESLKKLKAIICLGRVSHESTLRVFNIKLKEMPFSHRSRHSVPHRRLTIFDSYHCSRYNINTGRLTETMFDDLFSDVAQFLAKPAPEKMVTT